MVSFVLSTFGVEVVEDFGEFVQFDKSFSSGKDKTSEENLILAE